MKLLNKLYHISSPSGDEAGMMQFIRIRLDRLGVSHHTDHAGNIYATKGVAESYPCVIAHTDEVHSYHEKGYRVIHAGQKNRNIIFGFNYLTRSHCGIGADDKNGICICLKCLEEFDVMKCLFFVGEEIGCQGSSNADMQFFDDCRFVVQCDRKGNSDIVTKYSGYALCSEEFLNDAAPEKFGYRPSEGLITDVITLKKRGLQVSGVNISCGYYLPHTPNEFTCVKDLMKCFRFIKHIIKNCNKTYHHQIINSYMDEYTPYNPFSFIDDFSFYGLMDNNKRRNNFSDERIHKNPLWSKRFHSSFRSD